MNEAEEEACRKTFRGRLFRDILRIHTLAVDPGRAVEMGRVRFVVG